MDKIINLGMIVMFTLIVSGCGMLGGGNGLIDSSNVQKGFDGLSMLYTQNAPPLKVFEEDSFPVIFNLKNKGAFDIEEGILVLGVEGAYLEVVGDSRRNFSLEGKSIFNPKGGEDFINIKVNSKEISGQSETRTTTLLSTVCYPYKTVFGSSVCVDTDVYNINNDEKSCVVSDMVFGDGQGAPIAITKIETRMLSDGDEGVVRPHFFIHIENKGNGEVVKLDKVGDACSSEPGEFEDFPDFYNVINVKAELSGQPLNCNGEKPGDDVETKLRDKNRLVRCTLEKGIDKNEPAYTTPLKIEIDYGYTFTISKDIIIEKILTH